MIMPLLPLATLRAQFEECDFDTKYATELIKQGELAPDFKLKTPEGKSFSLKSLKGKVIVLDFWASWCPDCRKDAPEIVMMYNEYHPKGIEFVGVSMDTDVEAWKSAIAKYGIKYPQVSELKQFKETNISKAYGVKWIPSIVVIGAEGKVLLSTVLSYKVDKLLKEMTSENKRGEEERLTIQGSQGKLQAIMQKPQLKEGDKCQMVMLCHGFGGSKDGPLFELIADSLQKNGIASIRFDFNGHGESEGDFKDMTVPNEIEDAKMVYEYVKALPFVSDISIVGHSQGGVVSAMVAGELGTEAFKSVVLLAPAAVLRDDAIRGNTMGKMYNPLDPPEYVEMWDGKKLGAIYIRSAFSLPIYETAVKYQGPMLVVHGNADRVVPYTYGQRFHQQNPNSKFVLLEYYDHGFSQNIYRATDLVSRFLEGRGE